MSWQEYRRTERSCYCKEGKIITVSEDDDWNRYREYEIIECPKCAEEARLAAIKEANERARDDERLKTLRNEVNHHFDEHYMEKWISVFSSCKSKKSYWELAKKLGVEASSLSNFYTYYKGNNSNMNNYIKSKTSISNMNNILKALNINDEYLQIRVNEALEISKYRGGSYIWNR
ncbi:MAG: hypothetical protein ACI35O_12865 [Bacillaceae bacterium]